MTEKQTELVEINSASIEELISISGIGDNLAKRIVHHRPYQEIHDLVNVSGINEKKLAALLPYITIKKISTKKAPVEEPITPEASKPTAKFGGTEAFVFLEDRNERQDAILIILGGFIFGLLIFLLRRSRK